MTAICKSIHSIVSKNWHQVCALVMSSSESKIMLSNVAVVVLSSTKRYFVLLECHVEKNSSSGVGNKNSCIVS